MENTKQLEGMYLKDALSFLGIGRTTFYTHHLKNLTVTKDASGYRNIFLKVEIEALKKKLDSPLMVTVKS